MIGYNVHSGKLIYRQTSEYAQDCSCGWEIIFADEHEHTVREFVDEILKMRSKDWGSISINDDGLLIYHNVIEYYHGEIKTIQEEWLNKFSAKRIKTIRANGGFTLMDYFVRV